MHRVGPLSAPLRMQIITNLGVCGLRVGSLTIDCRPTRPPTTKCEFLFVVTEYFGLDPEGYLGQIPPHPPYHPTFLTHMVDEIDGTRQRSVPLGPLPCYLRMAYWGTTTLYVPM